MPAARHRPERPSRPYAAARSARDPSPKAAPTPAPPLPLQQHPAFAAALRLLGRRAEVVPLGEAGALGAALVVARRVPLLGEISYLPRGPAWAPGAPAEARAGALRRLPVRLLEAEAPCPSLRLSGFAEVATAAHVAEIDLAGPPEARRAAMAPKWRAELRAAERGPLRVAEERFDGDPSHWLLAAEAAQRRARGYRALPQALAPAFARASPGGARLWVAREGGEPVAGMLMLLHPPVATYQLGWSGPRGRTLSAHHFLLARAADALAARGFVRLDLGSLDTEDAPGLARFKLGSGARARPLGGSWLRLPLVGRWRAGAAPHVAPGVASGRRAG